MDDESARVAHVRRKWEVVYAEHEDELLGLITRLQKVRQESPMRDRKLDWVRAAVVYCLYVDLFATDFSGLNARLDYLEDLGANTLWLLPILDSPMRDGGFDVRDYDKVRPDLVGDRGQHGFDEFVTAADRRGIRVIFDVPLNHCSDEHAEFLAALSSPSHPARKKFIWSTDSTRYGQCRLLFKGLVHSNWEPDAASGQLFFHRFYPFQPDWNYRNPQVLVDMIVMLARWTSRGVAGFRLDAIPYLWKEEGTDCENLAKTHAIIKVIRAALDFVSPGTLLLAEACQPPEKIVEYFGDGDECNAAYHFPLMPKIFLALARGNAAPIIDALDPKFTPLIPEGSTWFTFLRCHDELTFEMVSPSERAELHTHYCRDPSWDFREGEGVSARLATLLGGDVERILLAWALLISLPGTPILFYGDEVAKPNDEAFFAQRRAETGFADSRFLVRGRMDWSTLKSRLDDDTSDAATVHRGVRKMLALRKGHDGLKLGSHRFVTLSASLRRSGMLAIERAHGSERALVVHNLGRSEVRCAASDLGVERPVRDLGTGETIFPDATVVMAPSESRWFDCSD